MNLRPSGYEPDEMSGFLPVFGAYRHCIATTIYYYCCIATVSPLGCDSGYFFTLSLPTPRDFSNDLIPPSPRRDSVRVISSSVCNFGSLICGNHIAVAFSPSGIIKNCVAKPRSHIQTIMDLTPAQLSVSFLSTICRTSNFDSTKDSTLLGTRY